jgi:hypothetical protein
VLASRLYQQISEDLTMHDRGVPYLIGGDGAFGDIYLQALPGGAPPLLTIEPGVTLKFAQAGRLLVDAASHEEEPAQGALRAVGTPEKPITFTSAEATPNPGDWVGIVFNGTTDPRSSIDHAVIAYAGGDTGIVGFSCGTPDHGLSIEAAVIIRGIPPGQFITNSTISHSAINGIERAWTGAGTDFRPTNTFEGITHCVQTYPRPVEGSCDDPPPCDQP